MQGDDGSAGFPGNPGEFGRSGGKGDESPGHVAEMTLNLADCGVFVLQVHPEKATGTPEVQELKASPEGQASQVGLPPRRT